MDDYYNKRASGLKGGESVKLHYIDSNGVDQGTVFPNGVKIGWFLLNDSFYGGNSTPFYSTTELNEDNRTHTAAFRIDDFIVLSFEDWTDEDYNDSQFNVWSNPIEPSPIRIFLILSLAVVMRIRNTVWNTKESSLSKTAGPTRVTMI